MSKFAQTRPAKKPKEEMFALHFMTQKSFIYPHINKKHKF